MFRSKENSRVAKDLAAKDGAIANFTICVKVLDESMARGGPHAAVRFRSIVYSVFSL